MAEAVYMIALSPTMNDGVIAEWLVKEGQTVKAGDALCEVETDKATMTYESANSGEVLKLVLPAGSSASVGQLIAVIGAHGEDYQAIIDAQPGTNSATTTSQPPEPKAAEPDHGAKSAPAPQATPAGQGASLPSLPALGPTAQPATMAGAGRPPLGPMPKASPLARTLARAAGIDIRLLEGSGPAGRVVARDVRAAQAGLPAGGFSGGLASTVASGGPVRGQAATTSMAGQPGLRADRVPNSKMRSIIATRLGESYQSAPHYFVRMAIDMENLLDLRARLNHGRDPALSLNAFIVKLTALALERHPLINSSWQGDAIQYLPHADIGMAVAIDGGLITPVVRQAELAGIASIDHSLRDLIGRARSGSLQPEEYSNASFTISNLGAYGVEEFTAIINPPGSAILALGASQPEAVVREGQVVARRILHASLSADHRVIDGASAAAFMAELKTLFEEPAGGLL